jgi:hypothetical protein
MLSYADLAERLKVSPEAARALAKRPRLPRSRSNGGKAALVSVDLAEIQHNALPGRSPGEDAPRLPLPTHSRATEPEHSQRGLFSCSQGVAAVARATAAPIATPKEQLQKLLNDFNDVAQFVAALKALSNSCFTLN